MSGEPEWKTAAFGSSEHEAVMSMVELIRRAPIALQLDTTDPQTMMLVATAGAFSAGMQFGALEVVGALKPQDQRRFVEMAVANIRNGIRFGRERAARIDREISGATTQ